MKCEMYIPKIAGNPAFLPYIFKLRKYRVARFNDEGKKVVLGYGRFIPESEWVSSSYDNLDSIRTLNEKNAAYLVDLVVEGEIDGVWIPLKNIEILYELQNI